MRNHYFELYTEVYSKATKIQNVSRPLVILQNNLFLTQNLLICDKQKAHIFDGKKLDASRPK